MSQQHDYVIGKNAVIETLKSDRKLYKLWMAENTVKGQAQQVMELAKKRGVTIQFVPRKNSIRWWRGSIRVLSPRWRHMNMHN